mmetsp:Transcript_35292/g.75191  ORF Transcript_35292/g.75191 Transcript_35292/m.75191 type:complete len:634 (-) Transcript_35292:312-2213(-)
MESETAKVADATDGTVDTTDAIDSAKAEKQDDEGAKTSSGAAEASGAAAETGSAAGKASNQGTAPVPSSSSSSLYRPRYTGRVKSFSEQKGFGFIDCSETLAKFGRDVFVHKNQIWEAPLVYLGSEVTFEVDLNENGQPQARKLQPVLSDISDSSAGCGGWGMNSWNYANSWTNSWAGGGDWSGYGNWGGYDSYANSAYETSLEEIEEQLRQCQSTSACVRLIEQHLNRFQKKQLVKALYQLGLCRHNERLDDAQSGKVAVNLVEALAAVDPSQLEMEEVNQVLWALAMLPEIVEKDIVKNYVVSIGMTVSHSYQNHTPSQMISFLNSMTWLLKDDEGDGLISKVTTKFSDWVIGDGGFKRFPEHEMRQWMDFLSTFSGQSRQPGDSPSSMYGKGPSSLMKGGLAGCKGSGKPEYYAGGLKGDPRAAFGKGAGGKPSYYKGGYDARDDMYAASMMQKGVGPWQGNGRGGMMPDMPPGKGQYPMMPEMDKGGKGMLPPPSKGSCSSGGGYGIGGYFGPPPGGSSCSGSGCGGCDGLTKGDPGLGGKGMPGKGPGGYPPSGPGKGGCGCSGGCGGCGCGGCGCGGGGCGLGGCFAPPDGGCLSGPPGYKGMGKAPLKGGGPCGGGFGGGKGMPTY